MLPLRISQYFVRNLRNTKKSPPIQTLGGIQSPEASSEILPLTEDQLQSLSDKSKFTDFQFTPHKETSSIDKASSKANTPSTAPLKQKLILKEYVKSPCPESLTEENQYDKLAEVVTPLIKISYQKQLKLKQKHAELVLKELRKKLKAVEAPFASTLDRLPCPLENIIPSPDIIAYRNKDEFSVNLGVDNDPKTVGHFYGSPSDPNMRCISPKNLINIKDSHKLVAKHFEEFIRRSKYNTCFKFSEGGVWRSVVVRSNAKGEVMVVVIIFPGDLGSPEEKEAIKYALKEYFFEGEGRECGIASLHLQACPYSKCTRDMAPYELIEGRPYIEEECLGKVFRISPDSFFQTNTKAAELLYKSIQMVAETSSLTTLLDICCGTGPISVLLAPQCRGVIGIDSVASAISDARINANRNGVTNINYIHGKVEKVLPLLTKDLEDSSDVVAVVNPARAGLHPSVIDGIRSCHSIRKLLFVTCKPEGMAMHNMAMLGSTLKPKKKFTSNYRPSPKMDLGEPFTLRYAIPVDMFPYTGHTEYLFLFDRNLDHS